MPPMLWQKGMIILMLINNVPQEWQISFKIEKDSLQHAVLKIENASKEILCAYLHGSGIVEVVALFGGNERPLVLYARYKSDIENRIDINFVGHRLELYVNGVLQDEEWPLGDMPLENSVCSVCQAGFQISDALELKQAPIEPKKISIKAFKPDGHNVYAGDCMPFEHDGTYHLFYLYDRRRHNSKYGFGAHQWAHIATDNLTDWYEYPMAISIDEQHEGSICTGSFIYHNGQFYAFYAVRMSDGSPAKITWSVSADCINFTKTHKKVTLSERFHSSSARDPKVFLGEDGRFHMLVTTSKNDNDRRGALAHLVSADLENWEELSEAFISVESCVQPECPDYFKFGDWYYLIYSLDGQARYFISKNPFSGWRAPNNSKIGTESFRVPKIASFGGVRLIAAGFIPVMSGGYGGEISCLEAWQTSDGTLRFGLVAELL